MFTSNVIITYLDKLRISHGLKISDFTKNIRSERNYSRYLSGQNNLPFNVLIKYIERLSLKIEDFFVYVYTDLREVYLDQLEFVKLVKANEFEKAKNLYNKLNLNKKTEVSSLLVPISYCKIKYHLNTTLKNDFIQTIKSKLNLEKLLKSNTITREEYEVLFIYLEVADTPEQNRILNFLEKAIFDKTLKVVSLEYNYSMLYICLKIIEILTQGNDPDLMNHSKIQQMINKILNLSKSFNIIYIYDKLFPMLIKYNYLVEDKTRYELSIFYYLSYQYSIGKSFPIEYQKIYLKYILQESQLNKEFYQELSYQL